MAVPRVVFSPADPVAAVVMDLLPVGFRLAIAGL